jgi:hypothetical protein
MGMIRLGSGVSLAFGSSRNCREISVVADEVNPAIKHSVKPAPFDQAIGLKITPVKAAGREIRIWRTL